MHVFNLSDVLYRFISLLPCFEFTQQYAEQKFLSHNNAKRQYSVTW